MRGFARRFSQQSRQVAQRLILAGGLTISCADAGTFNEKAETAPVLNASPAANVEAISTLLVGTWQNGDWVSTYNADGAFSSRSVSSSPSTAEGEGEYGSWHLESKRLEVNVPSRNRIFWTIGSITPDKLELKANGRTVVFERRVDLAKRGATSQQHLEAGSSHGSRDQALDATSIAQSPDGPDDVTHYAETKLSQLSESFSPQVLLSHRLAAKGWFIELYAQKRRELLDALLKRNYARVSSLVGKEGGITSKQDVDYLVSVLERWPRYFAVRCKANKPTLDDVIILEIRASGQVNREVWLGANVFGWTEHPDRDGWVHDYSSEVRKIVLLNPTQSESAVLSDWLQDITGSQRNNELESRVRLGLISEQEAEDNAKRQRAKAMAELDSFVSKY